MSSSLYEDATPDEVKNAKVRVPMMDRSEALWSSQGIHLITTNTPNGQKIQILLEELKELYGTEWTTSLM